MYSEIAEFRGTSFILSVSFQLQIVILQKSVSCHVLLILFCNVENTLKLDFDIEKLINFV